jgi:hypothetical protein
VSSFLSRATSSPPTELGWYWWTSEKTRDLSAWTPVRIYLPVGRKEKFVSGVGIANQKLTWLGGWWYPEPLPDLLVLHELYKVAQQAERERPKNQQYIGPPAGVASSSAEKGAMVGVTAKGTAKGGISTEILDVAAKMMAERDQSTQRLVSIMGNMAAMAGAPPALSARMLDKAANAALGEDAAPYRPVAPETALDIDFTHIDEPEEESS